MTAVDDDIEEYDLVVIGGGVMGLSVAWRAIQREPSIRVLVLEQFSLLHDRGSSHGDSRTIRSFYHHDIYVSLVQRAYQGWHQLETESYETLLYPDDMLLLNEEPNARREKENRFRRYNLSVETLTTSQLRERFPAFDGYQTDSETLLDVSTGGVIHASCAMRALFGRVVARGGRVRGHEAVTRIVRSAGHVTVTTNRGGRYRSSQLAVATGAWTGELLRRTLGISVPLAPRATAVAYFRVIRAAANIPALYDADDQVFLIPEFEVGGHVKLGTMVGPPVDPDAPAVTSVDPAVARLTAFVRRHFEGWLEPTPAAVQRCVYTDTPDEDFIIDRLPGDGPRIVLAAGFSGHGFKMAPVVGDVVCDLLTGRPLDFDASVWQLDRFSKLSKL